MKFSVYVFLLVPLLAFARLGETEAQLAARFGAATMRGKEITLTQGNIVEFGRKLTFRQDDWMIESALVEGRSLKEVYQKRGEWTEEHFTTVLTSNAQGAKWADVSKASARKLVREWRREDGGTATWQFGVGMIVTHPAYRRAKETAEAKAKAEASRIPKI